MYKKLGIVTGLIATFAFAFVAQAAVTVSPTKVVDSQPFAINCANDAHYYGIFQVSNDTFISGGECDAVAEAIDRPGNFRVLVGASAYSDAPSYSFTTVEETTIQVTPYFATGGDPVANELMGNSFTGFLSNIGSFLVTQLPAVLATLAALIGLGFLLTRVRRWIGKKA